MPGSSRDAKRTLFWLLTAVLVLVAISYVVVTVGRRTRGAPSPVPPPTSEAPAGAIPTRSASLEVPARPSPAPPSERPDAISSPSAPAPPASARFAALNMGDSDNMGTVMFASVDAITRRTGTSTHCERVYFSRDKGICLSREIRLFAAQTVATILDAASRPLFVVRSDGIPSRARISADGHYAAFTTFVTGHSYADAQLSTATLLIETTTRSTPSNLEQFAVIQDGAVLQAPDFNFWGVTFQRDSNFFYATLRTGGNNYLVHGDIRARTVTILYKGVECPSLSPDETRVAFKKLISRGNWRLSVLDLSAYRETPLAETRSVDDQAEWLDNDHVLYAMVEDAPSVGTDILVVPADGRGQPQVFAQGAASPAVIR